MKNVIYLIFILALALDHVTTTAGLLLPEKPLVFRVFTCENGTYAGYNIPVNQKIGVWSNPNIYEVNPVVNQLGLFWWTVADVLLVSSIILIIECTINTLRFKYAEFIPLILVLPALLRFYVGSMNVIQIISYLSG